MSLSRPDVDRDIDVHQDNRKSFTVLRSVGSYPQVRGPLWVRGWIPRTENTRNTKKRDEMIGK